MELELGGTLKNDIQANINNNTYDKENLHFIQSDLNIICEEKKKKTIMSTFDLNQLPHL